MGLHPTDPVLYLTSNDNGTPLPEFPSSQFLITGLPWTVYFPVNISYVCKYKLGFRKSGASVHSSRYLPNAWRYQARVSAQGIKECTEQSLMEREGSGGGMELRSAKSYH